MKYVDKYVFMVSQKLLTHEKGDLGETSYHSAYDFFLCVCCDMFVFPLRVRAWMVLMFGPPSVKGRTHLVRRSFTTLTLCTNPLFNPWPGMPSKREPQVATKTKRARLQQAKVRQ